jgi:hypothetical protein
MPSDEQDALNRLIQAAQAKDRDTTEQLKREGGPRTPPAPKTETERPAPKR